MIVDDGAIVAHDSRQMMEVYRGYYYVLVTIVGSPCVVVIGTMTRNTITMAHPLVAFNTVMAHSHRASYSCTDLEASCFLMIEVHRQGTATASIRRLILVVGTDIVAIGRQLVDDDFGSKGYVTTLYWRCRSRQSCGAVARHPCAFSCSGSKSPDRRLLASDLMMMITPLLLQSLDDLIAASLGCGYGCTSLSLAKSSDMSACDLHVASSGHYSTSNMTSNGLSSASFAVHRCTSHDCSCTRTGSESASRSQCRALFQACECWPLHGNSSDQHGVSPNPRRASAGRHSFLAIEFCAPRSRGDGNRLGVPCYFR